MSPLVRALGCCLVLALLPRLAAAQEEEFSYEYILDDQTEMTLTSHARAWIIDLRQFGEPAAGQIFAFNGELKPAAKETFEFKGEGDRNQKLVRLVGKPGMRDGSVDLSTRNLTYDDTKPVHIHGTFKIVDPILREVRTKERFQKADAALNELIARTLLEIGKSAEPKLREAQAERIKLRDTRAVAELGDPEAPVKGLGYWTSLHASTLESIAFFRSYTGRAVTKGLGGSYRAANGSALEVDVPEEGLHFSITVPHSDPALAGQMTGLARLNGARATYKEALGKKEAGDAREPAELIFTFRNGHIIHVEAKNTDAYTGAALSFAGDYYKMAPPAPRK